MIYREGIKLPIEDAMALLNETDASIEKVSKVINSLTKGIASAKMAIEIEKDMLGEHQDEVGIECYTRAAPICEDLFSCIRNNTLALYRSAQISPEIAESLDENDSAFSEKQEMVYHQNRVIVRLESDEMFIKLPMLWTKNGRRIRGLNNKNLGPDRITFFREDIVHGIQNSPEFSTFDFSKLANKIIHFMYVYEALPNNKLFIADNDNHETKYIQDAVAMFLPGGDTPLTCSTFSSAIETSRIPEGTYLTVTAMDAGVKKSEDIVSFWAEILAKLATDS